MLKHNILIIGAGRVGSSLYRAFSVFGHSVKLYDRKKNLENYKNKAAVVSSLQADVLHWASIISIAVNDDSITQIARELDRFDLAGKTIFHTAGALDSSALSGLEKKGAYTASIHPMQTFTERFPEPDIWKGIFCSSEGSKNAYQILGPLFFEMGCPLTQLTKKQKQALHVAAVFSSNYLMALFSMAQEITESMPAGLDIHEKVLKPLVRQSIENYSSKPFKQALSGPLQRGDIQTIQKHLVFLDTLENKDLKHLYRLLGAELLKNDDLDIKNRPQLKELLIR